MGKMYILLLLNLVMRVGANRFWRIKQFPQCIIWRFNNLHGRFSAV